MTCGKPIGSIEEFILSEFLIVAHLAAGVGSFLRHVAIDDLCLEVLITW
jgi:hypothetical protein